MLPGLLKNKQIRDFKKRRVSPMWLQAALLSIFLNLDFSVHAQIGVDHSIEQGPLENTPRPPLLYDTNWSSPFVAPKRDDLGSLPYEFADDLDEWFPTPPTLLLTDHDGKPFMIQLENGGFNVIAQMPAKQSIVSSLKLVSLDEWFPTPVAPLPTDYDEKPFMIQLENEGFGAIAQMPAKQSMVSGWELVGNLRCYSHAAVTIVFQAGVSYRLNAQTTLMFGGRNVVVDYSYPTTLGDDMYGYGSDSSFGRGETHWQATFQLNIF